MAGGAGSGGDSDTVVSVCLDDALVYMDAHALVGKVLRVSRDVPAGTLVLRSHGTVLQSATMHTIQLNATEHLYCDSEIIYTSHSFRPSCRMEINSTEHWAGLVALHDLAKDTELSFNYNTTEWVMESPFRDIDSDTLVKGFKFLSEEEKRSLLPQSSGYIKSMYVAEQACKRP
jgi:hypothetical protein